MVGQVCANYRPVAQAKGVTLACEAPAGVMLECDRTRLVQVLNNLVHNALKFTDSGRVSVHARLTPTHCVFEVADTGCGIAPDQLEAIFERFRQVHDFETRAHGGTGLGLALCKELAELMGGGIEVRSTPGEGSVFSVRLPRSAKVPVTPASSANTRPSASLRKSIWSPPRRYSEYCQALYGVTSP